jgi:uncharacterized membrane protein YdjX (TVP38/TMEM64 family)
MTEFILEWLPDNKLFSALASIVLNVIISISGFLPSAFLTAINIAVFDFKLGLLISIVGEAIGAILSFLLYRKGLIKLSNKKQVKNKYLLRLKNTRGLEAICIVLLLRIVPFIPSGMVTLVASYSKMGMYSFGIASTLGKVPSLFIEAYAVNYALDLSKEWQITTLIFILLLFTAYVLWNKRNQHKK